jgi:hypothetical protein
MKKCAPSVMAVLLAVLFVAGCRNESGKEGQADSLVTDIVVDSMSPVPIFYQLLMPLDMSKVFEQSGATYDKEILNPVENMPNYSSSAKMAMNLGVYGVDLGYVKLFGDPQNAIRYFGTIHKLASQLGIPDDFFGNAIQRFEVNAGNSDSIYQIATNIYIQTDDFLKKAERGEASSFILLGGWIEGMYIAGKIMDQQKDQKEMISRLASQKYSLNNLITLLANDGDQLAVSRYLILLKQLRNSYNKVDIYYHQGKVDLDTIRKTILTDEFVVNIDPSTLQEINSLIFSIRKEIIN